MKNEKQKEHTQLLIAGGYPHHIQGIQKHEHIFFLAMALPLSSQGYSSAANTQYLVTLTVGQNCYLSSGTSNEKGIMNIFGGFTSTARTESVLYPPMFMYHLVGKGHYPL